MADYTAVPNDSLRKSLLELSCKNPQEQVIDSNFCGYAIADALESLDFHERMVLIMRFGFEDRVYTYRETAARLMVSKARILQIEKKALERLRHPLKARKLRPFYECI